MANAGTSLPKSRGRAGVLLAVLGWTMLVVLILPFVLYSGEQGWAGLTRDLSGENRFFSAEAPVTTVAIFLHMMTGALITFLAPLQLAGPVRRRFPAFHRGCGRILAGSAVMTGIGGLAFILWRGTQGGTFMDVGSTIYGLCVLVAAVQTFRHARARRFALHREWALRLFVLAIASWIYRMHYALWYWWTDGLWSEPDFSGWFDLVQVYAFYVPYLALMEAYIRATRGSERFLPSAA